MERKESLNVLSLVASRQGGQSEAAESDYAGDGL